MVRDENLATNHSSLTTILLGIDEVQIHKGHKYATLIYQIDSVNKRLLGVEEDRKESSLEHFFMEFDAGTEGEECRSQKVRWVCSDIWNFSGKANESRE